MTLTLILGGNERSSSYPLLILTHCLTYLLTSQSVAEAINDYFVGISQDFPPVDSKLWDTKI